MSQRPGSPAGGRKAGGAQRVRPSASRQGDAAQVDGVEQQRADVDIAARGLGRGLLRERALGAARSAPKDSRLAGLDQQRQGRGELARAQRVVGGNGVGIGHGAASGMAGSGAVTPTGRPAFARPTAPLRSSRPEAWGGSRQPGGGGARAAGSGAAQSGRVVMAGGGRGDAGQLRHGKAGGRDGAMTLRCVQVYGSSPTRDEVGAENTTRGKHGRDGLRLSADFARDDGTVETTATAIFRGLSSLASLKASGDSAQDPSREENKMKNRRRIARQKGR